MATITKFEDLEIWQIARKLNAEIFPLLEILEEKRSFRLKDQLDGSTGSVMDNIAEGFERDGNKEFVNFLSIAKASLGEVRSQLYRILDRKFIDEKKFNEYNEKCMELGNKIGRFMTYLKNSNIKGKKFIRSTEILSFSNKRETRNIKHEITG
jgi:four helix bundle protein